jgi:hypothetical protein
MKTTLDAVGWISIVVAAMTGINWIVSQSTTADGGSALSLGLAVSVAISGIVFLALGAIVGKLFEIEVHLRPAQTVISFNDAQSSPCGQMTAQRAQERGHVCVPRA